ncbi:hypothetical protein A2U01_0036440 [Trifolium medium]|uniref:Uncharacterized protein n=1 Tax=Trifolium medium TaxID=97028 RepID=A0A392PUE3_9FABA|nr:hypothetical protein [Trifolium medium]
MGMGIGGRGVGDEEEEEVVGLLGGGKEEKRFALPGREEDNATITIDGCLVFSVTLLHTR